MLPQVKQAYSVIFKFHPVSSQQFNQTAAINSVTEPQIMAESGIQKWMIDIYLAQLKIYNFIITSIIVTSDNNNHQSMAISIYHPYAYRIFKRVKIKSTGP